MRTQIQSTPRKFSGAAAIAGVMLFVCSITLFGADATDRALEQIKANAKEAITAAALLTTQSAKIRTVSDAVDALEKFYAIVQRMNESCVIIIQDMGSAVDVKKLSTGIADIREQTKAAGDAFALVIAKLPQDILTADAFMSVLQRINSELEALNKDLNED
ncbi:MAG: hypothetical protein LBC99_03865 [Spirochaetota bacterium]|jgi:hypothetical protein|nr:hypothetical protein [Spirochaetota bacterium]